MIKEANKTCTFETSITEREHEIKTLEEICTPVVDYIKKNWDPHCTVIITDSQIKLVRDEIGIPNVRRK